MRHPALVIRLVALLLLGLLSLSPSLLGSAQEATPGAMTGMPPHPAHIHTGTCAELGEVVHPLNDLGMGMPMGPMDGPMRQGTPKAAGTPMAGSMMMKGAPDAHAVETSVTTVPVSLDELLAAPHAINVHWSAAEIDRYIACGGIGGPVVGSDLVMGLGELNESGAVGMVWLHDNGDGTATVTVFLAPGLFAR